MRKLALEGLELRQLLTSYGGVEFPQGASSFADEVLFYRPLGSISPVYTVPEMAVGMPDYPSAAPSQGEVTLGQGGELGLRFIDNLLTNSSSADNDLWIFEIGPDVEASFISVRPTAATQTLLNATLDADGFVSAGRIEGATRGIDIDAAFTGFAAGTLKFDAVKIVDDPSQGGGEGISPGADIDAVGAISSAVAPASVSIEADDNTASEPGADTATFTVSRTGPIDNALNVRLGFSGTATRDVDYENIANLISIPAGAFSATFTLTPQNDSLVEGTETARIRIISAGGGTVPVNTSASFAIATIKDDDFPTVALQTLDASASETVAGVTSTGALWISRDALGADKPLSIKIRLAGTATYGDDYSIQVTGASSSYNGTTQQLTITFAANVRNATIYVKPVNDLVDEPVETVLFSLVNNPGYLQNAEKRTGRINIADNPLPNQ